MSLISWSDWFKIIFSFTFLVGAIILFQYFKLDTNFLITFILAIISIVISISFFASSSNLSRELKELVKEVNLRIQNIEKQYSGTSEIESISDKAETPEKKEGAR